MLGYCEFPFKAHIFCGAEGDKQGCNLLKQKNMFWFKKLLFWASLIYLWWTLILKRWCRLNTRFTSPEGRWGDLDCGRKREERGAEGGEEKETPCAEVTVKLAKDGL